MLNGCLTVKHRVLAGGCVGPTAQHACDSHHRAPACADATTCTARQLADSAGVAFLDETEYRTTLVETFSSITPDPTHTELELTRLGASTADV